jgi:hypothetical protein
MSSLICGNQGEKTRSLNKRSILGRWKEKGKEEEKRVGKRE